MARVEVPKGLLIGLVGLAAAAILGLVFQLGRESARKVMPGLQNNTSGVEPSAKQASMPMTVATPVPQPMPGMQTPESHGILQEEQGRLAPSATIPLGAAIPSSDPMRGAVAAYFQAVEAIQPSSNADPESMAQQVVAGLGKGDMSGFDGMIQQAQATRNRLYGITPPQPCATYHRESLVSLDAGLALMRDMKKALSSSGQDASASNLADRANALKARTDALQLQENALKQRYGLMK